ncbi:MAG TPA: hypothetical protein VGR57_07800 [Ktedonobacterales bacterium]|nr:hypothetical protein [Ktedonobacterales bacterium]
MRDAYSYEGILSAVGRALDDAAVQRVAIKDTGDGLVVEGYDATGQAPITLSYDVPTLFDLIEAERLATPAPSDPASNGTLRRFLARHELVGAR